MDSDELQNWFEANKSLLESSYVAAREPWQQSGVALRRDATPEEWEEKRRVIADCVDSSGDFLDIGCANGYLLECLVRWVGERGIKLTPHGLDFSEKLVALARQRLPEHADHIILGNAWDYVPARRYDFVRTELVYVPDELHSGYVSRLLSLFLKPGGKLLAAEYRGREHEVPELTIDLHLERLGFKVEAVKRAHWQGVECTRVATISAPARAEDRSGRY